MQPEPLHQPPSTPSFWNALINLIYCAKAMPPFDPNVTLIASDPRVWRNSFTSLRLKWNL